MANVNPINGIVYGFRLIGYLIAVVIVGIIVAAIGGAMAEGGDGGSILIGAVLGLVGMLVVFAGFLGMQYKVIADAVEQGMNASNASAAAPTGGRQQQRQGGRTRSQGGQQSGRTRQRQQQEQRQGNQQRQRRSESSGPRRGTDSE